MRIFALSLCVLWAGVAHAAPVVPAGTVLCQSLTHARQYQSYVKDAPDFAKDLLDRAACYISQGTEEMIPTAEKAKGFKQFKLISGQKVWAPAP